MLKPKKNEILPFCLCGCGERVSKKISIALTGENNPMFGKKGKEHPSFGIRRHLTEETKQLMKDNSPRLSGKNHPNYGRHHSEETKQEMSIQRSGKNHHMYGNHHKKETIEKISMNHADMNGTNNPNWKGGISYFPYCEKFDEDLKERVRIFFDRKCYVCGKTEQEQIDEMIKRGKRPIKKLAIHHVNYDKMICCNDVKPLFVPLCRNCHGKTQGDREYWEEFFTVSLNYLTDGECFIRRKEDAH